MSVCSMIIGSYKCTFGEQLPKVHFNFGYIVLQLIQPASSIHNPLYRLRERLLPVLVLMVRLPREGEVELRRVLRLPVLLRLERLPLRPLLGVPEGRDVTVPLLPPPKFGREAVLPPFPGLLCDPPPTPPWFPLPVPGLWLLSGR